MLKFLKNIIKNPSITGSEARQKEKHPNYILLDIREKSEWNINNIKDSKNSNCESGLRRTTILNN